MITIKYRKSLLPVVFLPLLFLQVHAQNFDEKTYQHKMLLMDSLSMYKMQDYDTLFHISISENFRDTNYKNDYYGWINKRSEQSILLVNINGKEIDIKKKEITGLTALPLNRTTIDTLVARQKKDREFYERNFASNYPLILWLYKKGKYSYSKELLPENDKFFSDASLRDNFGILYYDAMLAAYSIERNYPKAIAFGEHLSGSVFKGYRYQKTVVPLTGQLKNNPEDFKTFRLPDSLEWNGLKQKLSRNDQILYLADRLRLLNCIQDSQPGDISYGDYQYAISRAETIKLNPGNLGDNHKYKVVNPYIELIQMKLNLHEVELLLPYLLTNTYIPSYNYHRDFFPGRNLHRLNWVIESLIFEITNKLFIDRLRFDELTLEQKEAEVDKIKNWCVENAGLSQEALTIKILKTADKWVDFYAALQTAREAKYDTLLPIIVQRFYDFKGGFWPGYRGTIAKTMFELGNEKYISTVKAWNRDTTDIFVNLYSSLFLLKNDKVSYGRMMDRLEAIMKQCDGTAYYPNAMDLLLSMNDKRALKLAEGILNKPQFQMTMDWPYNLNFIKKLLALKSDYTFHFFSTVLEAYTPEEMARVHKDNDNMMAQNDRYVMVVDELKNGTSHYFQDETNAGRLAYIKALSQWFKTQYGLLKEGKPNELRLAIKQEDEPVTFIDTYHQ
jgi:hypothetical protein